MEGVMRWQRNVLVAAIVVMLLSCLYVLSGCSTVEVSEPSEPFRFETKAAGSKGLFIKTFLIVDTETGCQYLAFSRSDGDIDDVGGMTLLVDADGKPLLDSDYQHKEEVGDD